MKNQIKNTTDDAPSTTISADDYPGDTTTVNASGASRDDAAPKPFLVEGDGSWVGSRINENHERFLQKNREQLAAFEAEERERRSTGDTFRYFENALSEALQKKQMIEADVANYRGVNLALTIFDQSWNKGWSFFQTISAPPQFADSVQPSPVLAAFLVQKYGDEILKLAAGEYAALKTNSETSKTKSRSF